MATHPVLMAVLPMRPVQARAAAAATTAHSCFGGAYTDPRAGAIDRRSLQCLNFSSDSSAAWPLS